MTSLAVLGLTVEIQENDAQQKKRLRIIMLHEYLKIYFDQHMTLPDAEKRELGDKYDHKYDKYDSKTFSFNFDWAKDVNKNFKHKIYLITKSNGSLAGNKIKKGD